MNTNKVTLTAFGTTGVLLAASLTMLAIVSALVTFDAWPTRERGASPAEIAVENPHATRIVRSVRRASATTGGGAVGAGGGGASGGGGPQGAIPGGNPPGGGDRDGGPRGGGHGDGPSGNPSPPPHVGPSPPGEGDPGDGGHVGGSDGNPVRDVVETACGTVSSASPAAGGAVGACKPEAESFDDPAGSVDVEAPAAPVDVDVTVDVQMP
jgi:hypothetical protein